MSSERGGLLKTRAENFAHHLRSRLRSLSENENNSWDAEVNTSPDTEVYYDINSSLASPEEEVAEPIFISAQNRDSFSLQRSESSGSQYFDTLENTEEVPVPLSPASSVPSLKQIPILHLKTDRPATITNELTNILDADSGCSRVHEMSSLQFEMEINEKEGDEDSCDSHCLVENDYIKRDIEDVADLAVEQCVTYNCDVSTVEVDTRPVMGELSTEDSEEVPESTSNSFCVFCDIEQIKSSLSEICLENQVTDEEIIQKNSNERSELISVEEPHSIEVNVSSNNKHVTDSEENISLTTILHELKQELTSETEQNKNVIETKPAESDNLDSKCPSIEVRESSPTTVKTKEINDEEEVYDIETKRINFRRCSSLKSGKTPPGTPGRKKIVRFADVLGLDLADVKTFLDEVPTVPKSAYEDLHGFDFSSSPVVESLLSRMTVVTPQEHVKILVPLFQQPGGQMNFLDRVRENNVCLENAVVSDTSMFTITGLVRVKNIDFHKSVYVRYSINNWMSFSDLQATYVQNSCDGFSDKFSFVLYAHTLTVGQRLAFAIRLHSAGAQFWDSNGGYNYMFECTTREPPKAYGIDSGIPASPMETWASFY